MSRANEVTQRFTSRRMSRSNMVKSLRLTLERYKAVRREFRRYGVDTLDNCAKHGQDYLWIDPQWETKVLEGLQETIKDIQYWMRKQPTLPKEKKS